ncbi:hypothetical protein RSAG8_04630, partial [Rhizoctonia solani AG-8 WAC10335]
MPLVILGEIICLGLMASSRPAACDFSLGVDMDVPDNGKLSPQNSITSLCSNWKGMTGMLAALTILFSLHLVWHLIIGESSPGTCVPAPATSQTPSPTTAGRSPLLSTVSSLNNPSTTSRGLPPRRNRSRPRRPTIHPEAPTRSRSPSHPPRKNTPTFLGCRPTPSP